MTWMALLKRHESYMVKRQVWKEANLDYNAGALSIEELEEKLGRRLNAEDFANIGLTFKGIRNKPTVLNRLGKEKVYEMYREFAENLFGYGAGGETLEELKRDEKEDIEDITLDLKFLGYDPNPIVEIYKNSMKILQERLQ
ncbi:hypothetical protein QKV95_gp123 [Poseidoniales virus YSH_150918]|uniref:Uncharacterized protein n=1 Tax=Poseidoniales virus YSH_150918 TaxID=3071324 RepID=A0A976UBQ5_9CAUD|nr:hypothetical protein QKV95_gp123 [Yangshan Harbor Poseidoniales virus]UVF62600.1 hypothetical protein [Poseidoniales virus YSH_150918]